MAISFIDGIATTFTDTTYVEINLSYNERDCIFVRLLFDAGQPSIITIDNHEPQESIEIYSGFYLSFSMLYSKVGPFTITFDGNATGEVVVMRAASDGINVVSPSQYVQNTGTGTNLSSGPITSSGSSFFVATATEGENLIWDGDIVNNHLDSQTLSMSSCWKAPGTYTATADKSYSETWYCTLGEYKEVSVPVSIFPFRYGVEII